MTSGSNSTTITEQNERGSRTWRIPRLVRFLALALPIAVLIASILIIPGWIPLLPRVIRRGMTEALLRTVLIGYSVIFLAAFGGTPLSAWLLAKSRHKRKGRPWIARGFLVCLSCLFSLLMLELASGGLR